MKRRLWLFVLGAACVFMGGTLAAGAQPEPGQPSQLSQSLQSSQPTGGQPADPLAPVGSAFTYHGRLKDGGNPANGQYDLQFRLYDAAVGGAQVGTTQTVLTQTVADGLFTVRLDFGSGAFKGDARWLEITVRPAGGGAYTTLSPRHELTATPYAMSLRPGAVISGTSSLPLLDVSNSGGGIGVQGQTTSSFTAGVYGISTGASGYGVRGVANSSAARGVYGTSTGGTGVEGASTSGTGASGTSTSGTGMYGFTTSGGTFEAGVYGLSGGSNGKGVSGEANNGTSAIGVYGFSSGGQGVRGSSTTGYSVYGSTSGGSTVSGVYGSSSGLNGIGVWGQALNSTGARGVYGYSSSGTGVYGESSTGYAGYFAGNVEVTGTCCAPGAGSFKIDHPLDPANKYLYHSSVESSEMKNIYDGVAMLDAKGEAWVELPEWFEALNRDFRYQLTAIGAPMPNLYIAQKIDRNRFKIEGGKAGMELSWQVTGIRHDPYAEQHRIPVEEDKSDDQKGKYRHPTEHGQSESMGIDYEQAQQLKKQLRLQQPELDAEQRAGGR